MDRPLMRRGHGHGDAGWSVEMRDIDNQLDDLRSSVAYQKMINDDIANERMIEAKIKTSEFTSLCSGKKYFISHDGVVYACGKASVEDAKTISRRILDRTTPAGHVLGP